MWDRLIRSRIESIFRDISRREMSNVLAGLAPNVHHRFAGEDPLGGERHSRQGVELWFRRLFRLYPQLTFTVHTVQASGWPWNLTVTVEWTALAVPLAGPTYDNHGVHVIRVERGRVTHLHAYEDSQAVGRACTVMADAGIEEAAAPPIAT